MLQKCALVNSMASSLGRTLFLGGPVQNRNVEFTTKHTYLFTYSVQAFPLLHTHVDA